MKWKNSFELQMEYKDIEFQKNFAELFTLNRFIKAGLVSSGYNPPTAFGKAISLTSTGKEWVPRIQERYRDISQSEINLALFLKFYHNNLFIDVNTTNPESIRKILHDEIVSGRIRYPWVYDRLLYDRFFEMFPSETNKLSYEQTIKLIENTPNGVFQIRDMIVGPFGILNSYCYRYLPPILSAPLWHCSDPGCSALHSVVFSTGESKVISAATFILNECKRIYGSPSEWAKLFRFNFGGRADWHDDTYPEKLPFLLVNAFSEIEILNILKRIIEQYSKEIRQRFPKIKRFKSGSAEKISKGLTKPQCFQLILLMPNDTIIECLETLIDDQIIKIPFTETRRPNPTYGAGRFFDVICECSRFGVRSISRKLELAFMRLKRLIKELYKEKWELEQLEWRMRFIEGPKYSYEKLDKYIHTEDPKRIIRNLVLDSEDHIQRTFKILKYGNFTLPRSHEEEERLIEKILWKLGFNIELYPDYQRLFWERLEKFLETTRTYTTNKEYDREKIRGAGVNFFVSLEEILENSLSFITWALLSDHYGVTKFKCNFNEARQFMASYLNGRQLGSNEPLQFDAGGKNTLYPLVQGFAVLAELCKEIIENRENEFRRSKNELPHYYGKTELELFPFLHKALILDIRKEDCYRIIGFLKEITATLEKSQIFHIRNGIDHKRPETEFPSKEEIESACKIVAIRVNGMEKLGICPLIYLHTRGMIDQYYRKVVILKNYKGEEIKFYLPSQYRFCKLPSFRRPLIIIPYMHIDDSFELIRFEFEENSDYVEMWRNYPKKRIRVSSNQLEEQFDSEQEHP